MLLLLVRSQQRTTLGGNSEETAGLKAVVPDDDQAYSIANVLTHPSSRATCLALTLASCRTPPSKDSSRLAAVRRTLQNHASIVLNRFCSIVVILKAGPFAGKVAVIVEIIDHNRVRALCTRLQAKC